MPLQERRGERSRTVCSCDLENSNLDSPLEFRWVSRWLQEQTPATAYVRIYRAEPQFNSPFFPLIHSSFRLLRTVPTEDCRLKTAN